MHQLEKSFKTRGVLETVIMVIWLIWVKLTSLLMIFFFRLRGYNIAFSTLFYGKVWLQRSGKHSIVIGNNCDFGERVKLRCFGNGKIQIGNNVSVNEFSIIHSGDKITIGNNVVMGAFCYINDTNHTFKDKHTPVKDQGWNAKEITIEDNVWVGAHVTILDDVTLGHDSVIGAGAVVTKNVEPFSVVAGVPAKELYKR